MEKKLRVPEEIVALIRSAHPELKRKIKAGLKRIAEDSRRGKSLRDELKGLMSYPVGRFRIIYRTSGRGCIDIIAIGPRRVIYEETYRIIRKGKPRGS